MKYKSGFQPFCLFCVCSWGVAPGWDEGAPLALTVSSPQMRVRVDWIFFSMRVINSRLAATSACSASISATMACCLVKRQCRPTNSIPLPFLEKIGDGMLKTRQQMFAVQHRAGTKYFPLDG